MNPRDRGKEIFKSAGWFRGMAKQTLPEVRTETPETTFVQRFTPLGVAAAIVPWNFPIILTTLKVRSLIIQPQITPEASRL
jgi:acyl-CoA reductase-like NAD-dependent aldehyde dehydrogenase